MDEHGFCPWAMKLSNSDRGGSSILFRSQTHGAKEFSLVSALGPGQVSRRFGVDQAYLCILHVQSYRRVRHICIADCGQNQICLWSTSGQMLF